MAANQFPTSQSEVMLENGQAREQDLIVWWRNEDLWMILPQPTYYRKIGCKIWEET